jgi:hypothetical protein
MPKNKTQADKPVQGQPSTQADGDMSPRTRATRTFYRFLAQALDAFSRQMAMEAERVAADPAYEVPELFGCAQAAYPDKYKRFSQSPIGLYVYFFFNKCRTMTIQIGRKETGEGMQALGDSVCVTPETVIEAITQMIVAAHLDAE